MHTLFTATHFLRATSPFLTTDVVHVELPPQGVFSTESSPHPQLMVTTNPTVSLLTDVLAPTAPALKAGAIPLGSTLPCQPSLTVMPSPLTQPEALGVLLASSFSFP